MPQKNVSVNQWSTYITAPVFPKSCSVVMHLSVFLVFIGLPAHVRYTRPHRHPLFDFSFVCSLCCFLKPLHCSQNLSFVPYVELSNALNAAFFMVIDLFYLSREWVSVCVSLLSPSCPFVRNWAINLPECWEQNIHYNNQSFCSKQRKIPHKMCNLVGDEVILAGKYCTSGRSLHSPCLIL